MSDLGASGLSRVVEVLVKESEFVLVPHVAPDGDCIGSAIALYLALVRNGKRAQVASDEPVPRRYRFLPGAEVPGPFVRPPGRYVAVVLDCTDPFRCCAPPDVVAGAAQVVNIDHHVSNSGFGDVAYVDSSASAVGEIVFTLLNALGWGISAAEATCLYTAIATDTGSFRFENTTSRSLSTCATLVEAGASPGRIAEEVYETMSLPATILLGRALSSLRLGADGQVAWMKLTRRDYLEAGATDEDTEGIVNYARMIEGVRVGILLKEKKDGTVRVAFRSREGVDVSRLAAVFSGGGHPRAAGCDFSGTIDEAEDRIVGETLRFLKSNS